MSVRSKWAAVCAAVLTVGSVAQADVVKSLDATGMADGELITAPWVTLTANAVPGGSTGETTLTNSNVVAYRDSYAYNIQYQAMAWDENWEPAGWTTQYAIDHHWARGEYQTYLRADFATPAKEVSLDLFGPGALLEAFDASGTLIASQDGGGWMTLGVTSGLFNIAYVEARYTTLTGGWDFAFFNNLTATFEGDGVTAVPTPAAAPAAAGLLGLLAVRRRVRAEKSAE